MTSGLQNKVMRVSRSEFHRIPPCHAIDSIDLDPVNPVLMSLCNRPDALVLLPLRANYLLHGQQNSVETAERDTTRHQIHKPIAGYDHE
jgi:hypothetical protein